MKLLFRDVLRLFSLLLGIVLFVLGLAGLLLPFLPGIYLLALAILFIMLAIPSRKFIRTLIKAHFPGAKEALKIKKRLKKDEDYQMRFFALMVIKFFVIFLILAIIFKNPEFVYYSALVLPLFILSYLLHKKIHLHLVVFISLSIFFILHLAGGIFRIGGTRLYELGLYDYFVHFIGSAVLVFIIYNLIHKHVVEKKKSTFFLFFFLVFTSFGLSVLTEILAFLPIVFFNVHESVIDYFNNIGDLSMNLLGVVIATVVVLKYHRKKFFRKILDGKISVAKK